MSAPLESRCDRARWAPAAGLLAALAFLAACGGGEVEARASSAAAGTRARPRPASLPAQLPWSSGPNVARAVRALEAGDLEEARGAVAALGEDTALDRSLLTARLRAAEGDGIGMVSEIESLRVDFRDQGRVYATAAELHAVAGRLSSAEDEVRAGLMLAGPSPAISRARGILALTRPAGARTGLEHLLAARAAQPGLPFCDGPLTQAHVLLGRRALAEGNVLEALAHAQAALSARAGDRDALELLAEAQTQTGDYGGAIATYETLLAAGEDVIATLGVTCQRGSTAALLGGQRRLALERTLRARGLGLSDEELGFGATLIEEEAERALDRGIELFEAGKPDPARVAFELALRCRPSSLEATNHLGVARAALGDHAGAAELWSALLAAAAEDDLELPTPVHVSLARALDQAGRPDEARAALESYLASRPDGLWAEATRAELAGR